MKKNLIAIVTFSMVIAACGGGDKDKDQLREEEKAKALAEAKEMVDAQQAERTPITAENLTGKWEIVSSEPTSDFVGKTIEFTADSIFHYNDKGEPVRHRIDYRTSEEKINIWVPNADGESADSQTIYFQGEELIFNSPTMKSFHLKKV